MNGLRSYSYFFKSDDLVNKTAYYGWDFSGPGGALAWDHPKHNSFWYSKNTTLLWYTEVWKLGTTQVNTMGLKLTPSYFKEKSRKTDGYIFGIPYTFKDNVYKRVDWTGETMLNKDLRVPLKA